MAFCTHCGKQMDNAAFCSDCGSRLEGTVSRGCIRQGDGSREVPYRGNIIDVSRELKTDEFAQFANTRVKEVAPGLYLCGDGRYRWTYELDLWKNPVQLFTLIKCLGLTVGIVAMTLFVFVLANEGLRYAAIFFLEFSGCAMAGMLALGLLAYALGALFLGRYSVLNVMDQEGVTIYQFPKQCEKMQVIGWLCVLAGVSRGDPAQTMLGLQTAAKHMEEIEFCDISTVTVTPRQDTLKLRSGPIFSHVYADKGQLGFVLDFFRERTPRPVKYKYKGGRSS